MKRLEKFRSIYYGGDDGEDERWLSPLSNASSHITTVPPHTGNGRNKIDRRGAGLSSCGGVTAANVAIDTAKLNRNNFATTPGQNTPVQNVCAAPAIPSRNTVIATIIAAPNTFQNTITVGLNTGTATGLNTDTFTDRNTRVSILVPPLVEIPTPLSVEALLLLVNI